MKNLLKNIWEAPSSTISVALTASIGVIIAADIQAPPWVFVSLAASSAFLGIFGGPNTKFLK
jgi:hypothetical protein